MKKILLLILFISINYLQLNWATTYKGNIILYSNREVLEDKVFAPFVFQLEGHQDVMQKIFYTKMCTEDRHAYAWIDTNYIYIDSLLIDYSSARKNP